MRIQAILILPFLFSSPTLADEASLSLEQALGEGLHEAPDLQAAGDAKHAAEWARYSGLSLLLPHVAITAKHDFTDRYETVPENLGGSTVVVPEVFPKNDVGAEARWTLFNGGANINRYRASLDRLHAAAEELDRRTFETRKKIELAFYNALAARRFEEVAEENLKTLEENLGQVRARFKGGRATQYDVLRVEVQRSDATTEVERTRDNVVIMRKKLAQAMGRETDERPLAGTLPVPQAAQIIHAISAPDPTQRQDFRAAELREAAEEKEARAAKGSLIPAISLGANYDHYENTGYPGQAYGGYRDAWSVGLYASWSLFDGGASIAQAGEESAKADRARHEYQATLLTLPTDFEMWKRRYSYSALRFEAKKQDVERSTESFHISTVSFQAGRKTITDVLEAESDLFRARAGVVQSQLDAEEARINLELSLGKEI